MKELFFIIIVLGLSGCLSQVKEEGDILWFNSKEFTARNKELTINYTEASSRLKDIAKRQSPIILYKDPYFLYKDYFFFAAPTKDRVFYLKGYFYDGKRGEVFHVDSEEKLVFGKKYQNLNLDSFLNQSGAKFNP